MPNLDKTGPAGQGPQTGKVMGSCAGNKSAVAFGGGIGRRGCGRGLGQGRGPGRGRCCQTPAREAVTKE